MKFALAAWHHRGIGVDVIFCDESIGAELAMLSAYTDRHCKLLSRRTSILKIPVHMRRPFTFQALPPWKLPLQLRQ